MQWFVLNAEANVDVDLTALDALDSCARNSQARGIVFAMARVKQDLRVMLDAAGLLDKIGEDHIYPTLPTAVDGLPQPAHRVDRCAHRQHRHTREHRGRRQGEGQHARSRPTRPPGSAA